MEGRGPHKSACRAGSLISGEHVKGGLDDLDGLPVLRNLDLPKAEGAKDGERGDKLFRHLMRAAPHVDDFDSLLDVARTFNDNCEPPMEEYRMISTAKSAWGYEQRGENWFGRRKAYLPLDGVEDWTERTLAAALDRHGATPIIVRSGSGNHQAWYRHNGEHRPLSSISSTVILLRLPTMDPKALSFANFVAGWALAGSPIWS